MMFYEIPSGSAGAPEFTNRPFADVFAVGLPFSLHLPPLQCQVAGRALRPSGSVPGLLRRRP